MTTADEKLALDNEGIPILTDAIPPTVIDAEPELAALSPDEIVGKLLESEDFQQQIDEIAAKLTVNMRTQISETIKPAIEEAITRALNTSGDNTFASVRQQLESQLPEVLIRTLTRPADGK